MLGTLALSVMCISRFISDGSGASAGCTGGMNQMMTTTPQAAAPVTPKKIGVAKIVIERAEGYTAECGIPHTATSYEEASKILLRMSHTAPDGGSCDKTDFTVTFEDGETYTGEFALKRYGSTSIGEHIWCFLSFHAGLRRPAHLSVELYQGFLARKDAGEAASCAAWLEKYDLGMG